MRERGESGDDARVPDAGDTSGWQGSAHERSAREFSAQELDARRAAAPGPQGWPESERESFAARLAELLLASGLTQQRAAEHVQQRWPGVTWKVTAQRISDWKNARDLPRPEPLKGLLRVLIEHARRRTADPAGLTPGLLSEEVWQRWWRAAEASPARRGTPDTGRDGPDGGRGGPPGALRSREARPLLLGVHRPIEAAGAAADALPSYVARDVDEDSGGLRARVRAAAERGGFVLLVGEPSAGKTRTAYEAVLCLLPDWWVLHPRDAAEVDAFARRVPPEGRVVVWLDELEGYLDGPDGLTAATVRALLNAEGPVLVIATMRSQRYATGSGDPTSSGGAGGAGRPVLGLAEVVLLGSRLSRGEQARARALAASDPQLRAALAVDDHGLTQTLAAAPQLVARWEVADPYAKALLNAAVDAVRLGWGSELPEGLLRRAAPGYCDVQARAAAPGDWFETALAYVLTPLNGGVRALAPVGSPDGGMGEVAGYRVADYLLRHVRRLRAGEPGPGTLWDAFVAHATDPGDLCRLAVAAEERGLHQYAARLYGAVVSAG
ncbi:hypothetical protein ACQP1W_44245 [Spirillospora sp. CA-255316]